MGFGAKIPAFGAENIELSCKKILYNLFES